MERKTILKAQNLRIGYKRNQSEVTVMDDINLELKTGTLIALIGANGIGKSTLLRTLTGVQKPLAGSVLLDEKEITAFSTKELAQSLAVVFTESLPPSSLTAHELVALGRQPYTNWLGSFSPEDTEKVNDAIAMTQTRHLADKKHYEISDGQLQKILIARALAQDTPVIVLDEPTTHLDLQHKVNILRLLKKLAGDTGKCILYSTHDLDLALQLSDELIVMTQGHLSQGDAANLIAVKAFDRLFDDDTIIFDSIKGSFTIKNKV